MFKVADCNLVKLHPLAIDTAIWAIPSDPSFVFSRKSSVRTPQPEWFSACDILSIPEGPITTQNNEFYYNYAILYSYLACDQLICLIPNMLSAKIRVRKASRLIINFPMDEAPSSPILQ